VFWPVEGRSEKPLGALVPLFMEDLTGVLEVAILVPVNKSPEVGLVSSIRGERSSIVRAKSLLIFVAVSKVAATPLVSEGGIKWEALPLEGFTGGSDHLVRGFFARGGASTVVVFSMSPLFTSGFEGMLLSLYVSVDSNSNEVRRNSKCWSRTPTSAIFHTYS